MVVMGLAIVVCALTLSREQLAPVLGAVMIATIVIGVGLELYYRRLTRTGRPA